MKRNKLKYILGFTGAALVIAPTMAITTTSCATDFVNINSSSITSVYPGAQSTKLEIKKIGGDDFQTISLSQNDREKHMPKYFAKQAPSLMFMFDKKMITDDFKAYLSYDFSSAAEGNLPDKTNNKDIQFKNDSISLEKLNGKELTVDLNKTTVQESLKYWYDKNATGDLVLDDNSGDYKTFKITIDFTMKADKASMPTTWRFAYEHSLN